MRRYKATREWGRGGARRISTSRGRGKRRWPKYASLAVLLLAVFFFGRNFGGDKTGDIATPNQASLDIGGGVVESSTVQDVLSGSVLSIPLDNAIVLDAEDDAEASIAQDTTAISVGAEALEAGLNPVGGTHGSGSATMQYVNGELQHLIVATLPDPPVGYFYEGWLIRSKPFDFFSTGRMIQHADDLKWYLLYEEGEDKRDYKKVVVTLEPEDGDPAPADHVLEGQF